MDFCIDKYVHPFLPNSWVVSEVFLSFVFIPFRPGKTQKVLGVKVGIYGIHGVSGKHKIPCATDGTWSSRVRARTLAMSQARGTAGDVTSDDLGGARSEWLPPGDPKKECKNKKFCQDLPSEVSKNSILEVIYKRCPKTCWKGS